MFALSGYCVHISLLAVDRSEETVSACKNDPRIDARLGPLRVCDIAMKPGTHTDLGSGVPYAKFTPRGVFDGEPDGKVVYGIVHMFRKTEEADAPSPDEGAQAAHDDAVGTVLAILGMPAQITPSALLSFIEPAIEVVSYIRIIRQVELGRSIVLLKFDDAHDAEEFYKVFHHQPYDALDHTERCEIVYITGVSVSEAATLPHTLPLVADTEPWPIVSEGPLTAAPTPSRRLRAYELPTCPVCLDRMDASASGLVSVTCQHTFHCQCLQRWTDSRCPVCRYSLTKTAYGHDERDPASAYPTSARRTRCSTCGSSENLWVCLICAAVGCGRYQQGHARQHSLETGHLYALEIETQRVWDYAGDGYVHRLIQSQSDGKLVELPSASQIPAAMPETSQASTAALSGKMEAISLEYSDLIVSQLDSQRAYYERRLAALHDEHIPRSDHHAVLAERDELRRAGDKWAADMAALEKELAASRHSSERLEQQLRKALDMVRALREQYSEEKAVSDALSARVERLQSEQSTLQHELADVRDNLRDLMVYVSASEQIKQEGGANELAGGDAYVAPRRKR